MTDKELDEYIEQAKRNVTPELNRRAREFMEGFSGLSSKDQLALVTAFSEMHAQPLVDMEVERLMRIHGQTP